MKRIVCIEEPSQNPAPQLKPDATTQQELIDMLTGCEDIIEAFAIVEDNRGYILSTEWLGEELERVREMRRRFEEDL